MSSTATVSAVRLPPGAIPQAKGLYQFFPYMQTIYYDGTNYHDISTPSNLHVDNLNTTQQQLSVFTRPMNPKAPEYHPIFKLPSKEPKVVPIKNPLISKSDKDKVLEHIVGKGRHGYQASFTFKAPASDLNSSTSTLFSQKESTNPPEDQPPIVSDLPKTDSPTSQVKQKSGVNEDIVVQPLANATEAGQIISKSGWESIPSNSVNDASVSESNPAAAPVPSFSDVLDQPKNYLTTTSPDRTESISPVRPTQTLAAQTPVPDATRSLATPSVLAANGSLPSVRVSPPTSHSGWMPEIRPVVLDNRWGIPSSRKIGAEPTRIQQPQPIAFGGWGESHDDHAGLDELEIPTDDIHCETSAPHSEPIVPAKNSTHESQPTSLTSPQAPLARNDALPVGPPKEVDTKQAPAAPSTSKPKNDVTSAIQEWQMLSKKNMERNTTSKVSVASTAPKSNEKPSDAAYNKMAAFTISQPAEKPLEPKDVVKAEPKPCEGAQSVSEPHAPTALPKASGPEDSIPDAGTKGSSSFAQYSTINSMNRTWGQTGERAGEGTPTSDWPSTKNNENKEKPEKSLDVPSFNNSLTAMNPQQGKSTNTTSDRRDQASTWTPSDSNQKTMAPTRGPLLLRLKVTLPDGKLAFLEFHKGDNPQEIAERWCRVWKIPDAIMQAKIIADGIGAQLEKMQT